MILPTKRLSTSRSLIYVGAELLALLKTPKSVNQLWGTYSAKRNYNQAIGTITFEWFNLALDLLYMLNLVEFKNNQIKRVARDS